MKRTASGWSALYRVGATVAVLGVAGVVFDIVLTMMPGWGADTTPPTALAWLEQMSRTPLLGLRNLDLLNVVISFVVLPMYAALCVAFRRTRPGLAALGILTAVIGATLFAASNAALPMLGLAKQLASAADAAERSALVSAAAGLLARGAHGSYGAFPGFLLSEIATLLVAVGTLRGGVVRPLLGWLGVAGAGSLIVYSFVATFGLIPASMLTAFAAPGGLLVMAWQIAAARRLWRLAGDAPAGASQDDVQVTEPALA